MSKNKKIEKEACTLDELDMVVGGSHDPMNYEVQQYYLNLLGIGDKIKYDGGHSDHYYYVGASDGKTRGSYDTIAWVKKYYGDVIAKAFEDLMTFGKCEYEDVYGIKRTIRIYTEF